MIKYFEVKLQNRWLVFFKNRNWKLYNWINFFFFYKTFDDCVTKYILFKTESKEGLFMQSLFLNSFFCLVFVNIAPKRFFSLLEFINILWIFLKFIRHHSVTKYLRLILIFMWHSALQEKFNFCFWKTFCKY